jgi:hypothetical protein
MTREMLMRSLTITHPWNRRRKPSQTWSSYEPS